MLIFIYLDHPGCGGRAYGAPLSPDYVPALVIDHMRQIESSQCRVPPVQRWTLPVFKPARNYLIHSLPTILSMISTSPWHKVSLIVPNVLSNPDVSGVCFRSSRVARGPYSVVTGSHASFGAVLTVPSGSFSCKTTRID
jgi:hypothetical protein